MMHARTGKAMVNGNAWVMALHCLLLGNAMRCRRPHKIFWIRPMLFSFFCAMRHPQQDLSETWMGSRKSKLLVWISSPKFKIRPFLPKRRPGVPFSA